MLLLGATSEKQNMAQSEGGDDIKFFMIPEGMELEQSSLRQLRHPKSGSPAIFHISEDNQEICEVLRFEEDCRSWFLGDRVIEDGSLSISAPINPLFLTLPYLLSAAQKRYVPLDQMLEDSDFPMISRLVYNDQLLRCLCLVCDTKKIGDQELYMLNKKNLLSWLEGKFTKLKKVLAKQGQVHSSILKEDETLRRYAWGVLCDYLPPKVADWLKDHLSIKEPVVEKSPPLKRRKTDGSVEEPAENYCTPEAKAIIAKPPVLTTAQKKLKQASVGSKPLTSFFKKSASK